MADSFFGFGASFSNALNERDDGGGGLEPSEDEYDALNDETFGEAEEDGDWEQQHEEFSLLTENDKNQSDLEAFLSNLVLDGMEDASPSTSPPPLPVPAHPVPQNNNNLAQGPSPAAWMKNVCTVEELERSMRQQPQQQQQQPQNNKQQAMMMPFLQQGVRYLFSGPPLRQQQPQQPQQQQQQQQQQQMINRPPFLPQQHHNFNNFNQQNLQGKMPPPGMMPRPPQSGNLQAIEQQQQQIHHNMPNHLQHGGMMPTSNMVTPHMMPSMHMMPHNQNIMPHNMMVPPQVMPKQNQMMPMMGHSMLPPQNMLLPPNMNMPQMPPQNMHNAQLPNMNMPNPQMPGIPNTQMPSLPNAQMPLQNMQNAQMPPLNMQNPQLALQNMQNSQMPLPNMGNAQLPNMQNVPMPSPSMQNSQMPNMMHQNMMNSQMPPNMMGAMQNAQKLPNVINAQILPQNMMNAQIPPQNMMNIPTMNFNNSQMQLQNNMLNKQNLPVNVNNQSNAMPLKTSTQTNSQGQKLLQNIMSSANLNQHNQKVAELAANKFGFPAANGGSNGTGRKPQSTSNIIQMIQNTHPMLQNSGNRDLNAGHPLMYGLLNNLVQRGIVRHTGNATQGLNSQPGMMRKQDGDQYSGLMSQREKQWLLNIQLLQLNTGTPYIDDYYYTVFLDRQSRKDKEEVKEAHRANQQNHPFSQQNLNKNSNANNNNEGRERRNSARSSNNDNNKEGPRHYVPAQFENSLGKIQCVSVTAPRKIIDMEVVGGECDPPAAPNLAAPGPVGGASRSLRLTLLSIEALYLCLLRLEDLQQPLAIANALVLKEREEKQKALLAEQAAAAESADLPAVPGVPVVRGAAILGPSLGGPASQHPSAHTSLLEETKPGLLNRLFKGLLNDDALPAIVNVRKGKTLLVRILAQAVPTERWRAPLGRLWPLMLLALPSATRRDSQLLTPLTTHFRQYLDGTEGWAPVSDLCLVLGDAGAMLSARAGTPGPQRSLLHLMLNTPLGLSLLIALLERASVLPQPRPLAWHALLRALGRQAGACRSGARPLTPLSKPALLKAHAEAAGLKEEEFHALKTLMC